jgi:hypothetical protein
MIRSHYKICKQINQVGLYAEIDMTIERRGFKTLVDVHFDSKIENEFRSSLAFGCAYAWEHVPSAKKELGGVAIKIIYFDWQICDTTCLLAAYVSANAVWKGLGLEAENLIGVDVNGKTMTWPIR